jgi:hypothetical protein
MIPAGETAFSDLAEVERSTAVAAHVQKGGRVALGVAEQHDRVIEDTPRERTVGDVVGPGGDIPGIADEHLARSLLHRRFSSPLVGYLRPLRGSCVKTFRGVIAGTLSSTPGPKAQDAPGSGPTVGLVRRDGPAISGWFRMRLGWWLALTGSGMAGSGRAARRSRSHGRDTLGPAIDPERSLVWAMHERFIAQVCGRWA